MTLVLGGFAAPAGCEAPSCPTPDVDGVEAVALRDGTERLVCPAHRELVLLMRPLLVPYPEYLRSPWWRARSAAELARTGGRCERCASRRRVEVHHHTYRNLWNEQPGDLEVLCHDCHSAHHDREP